MENKMGTTENLNVKNTLPFILVILLFLSGYLAACDIFGSDDKDKKEKETVFTVYSNLNDALLFSATTAQGDSIAYYGVRNDDGIPTGITGATVQMKNKLVKTSEHEHFIKNSTVEIVTGGLHNLPSKILTEDFTFHFDWESATDVVITTIDNNGRDRTQIAFDLKNPDQDFMQKSASHEPIFNLRKSFSETNSNIPLVSDFQCGDASPEINYLTASSVTKSSIISINRCGHRLGGANVNLRIDQSGKKSQHFPASETSAGSGKYSVNIPIADETIGEKVSQTCYSLVGAVGAGCDVAKELYASSAVICGKIAVSSGPLGPKVLAACLTGISGYAYYCSIANWSPDGLIEGAEWTTPAQIVCGSIGYVIDRGIDYYGDPLYYSVNIYHESLDIKKGEGSHEDIATSPASGPYPDIDINIQGDPEIDQLRSEPSNPAEGQNYVIYASLNCATQGDILGISIVGTDGYSDSTTCNQVGGYGNLTCYLQVPGAEGGVKDTITLTLNGNNIGNLTVIFRGGAKSLPANHTIARSR
jgi:hypothetical protein